MKYAILAGLLMLSCIPKPKPCISERPVECQQDDPEELEFWENDVAFSGVDN